MGVAVAILLAPRASRGVGLAILLCAGVEVVVLSVLNGTVAFRYACFGVTLVAAALLATFGNRASLRCHRLRPRAPVASAGRS